MEAAGIQGEACKIENRLSVECAHGKCVSRREPLGRETTVKSAAQRRRWPGTSGYHRSGWVLRKELRF